MSHPGNAIGYHGIMDKRHCRNNGCLSVPRSNVHPKTAADKTEGVCDNVAFTTSYARQKWKKAVVSGMEGARNFG